LAVVLLVATPSIAKASVTVTTTSDADVLANAILGSGITINTTS
jgi:hypothetical protein